MRASSTLAAFLCLCVLNQLQTAAGGLEQVDRSASVEVTLSLCCKMIQRARELTLDAALETGRATGENTVTINALPAM